ncbi:MAG: hypothetical protein JWN46_80 [Acidimicrobiales bacterium]|nr:hypothetical protein [Acidimicrobiales bacterium]
MTEAMEVMAALRLEDGRRWGEAAADFQIADARAVLEWKPGAPRQFWFGRAKGASKTTDTAGFGCAWLLTQAQPLDEAYVIASDQEQAGRLLRTAARLIARTPSLADRLEVLSNAIVNLVSGARVIALAADVAGTEGLLTPLIVCDELPNWADTASSKGMWTAAFSSLPKVPTSRLVVIGHAGAPGSWQHKLFEQAKKSPSWLVDDRPGPAPWTSEADLVDQRAMLLPFQAARRWDNVWMVADDRLTSMADLEACAVLDGPLLAEPGRQYVIGLDVGLKNDRTVATVCHAEPLDGGVSPQGGPPSEGEYARMNRRLYEGGAVTWDRYQERVGGLQSSASQARAVRIVVDRQEVWSGSRLSPVRLSDVKDWLLQAHRTFNRASLVFDPWQAIGLGQDLTQAGVKTHEFTFSQASVGRLASTLFTLMRDHALWLPRDPALLDELAHVQIRETSPGVVRLEHASGRHDDRALSIALGAFHLLQKPPPQVVTVTAYSNVARRRTR